MRSDRLQILLLNDYRTEGATTTRDHVDSLVNLSAHEVRAVSMLGSLPPRLDLDRFDAVVVHYSLVLSSNSYVSAAARAALREFGGLKAVFIQDEYRHVNATVAALREIGADLLFTNYPTEEWAKVYPESALPGLTKMHTLTGFVPEHLCRREVLPFRRRPIDVGYRSRRVPAWLGELGQDKWRIGPRFLEDVPKYGLVCDISNSEEDRLYGERWVKFLASCKAVLGTESGASVVDFDGSIQARVDAHVRSDPEVSFGELQRRYFSHLENRIRINVVSPRCFEAAALRTLMILYPGEYTGILTANRHYVCLEKDHSNIEEVVAILRDSDHCEEIIETAFQEIACNPELTFGAFVRQFDSAIQESWSSIARERVLPYALDEFRRDSKLSFNSRRRRFQSRALTGVYRLVFGKLLRFVSADGRHRMKLAISSGMIKFRGLLGASEST